MCLSVYTHTHTACTQTHTHAHTYTHTHIVSLDLSKNGLGDDTGWKSMGENEGNRGREREYVRRESAIEELLFF